MLVRLAWRNIGRGWRRSAVVVTSIAVGLSACVLVIAWSNGMMYQMADNAIRTQLAHISVQARGYQVDPDISRNLGSDAPALLDMARQFEGVHAAARARGDGLIQSARRSLRVAVMGVDPRAEREVSIVARAIVAGEFFADPARPKTRRLPAIVIGREMAENLRVDLGDKVVLHVPGEGGLGAFRVRGIYRTSSTDYDRVAAYIELSEAYRLFAVAGPTEVAIALDDPESAIRVQGHLKRAAAAALGSGAVEVLRWQEREPRLASLLELSASIYGIFYAIIFVAMAFGIANALLMAVYERIREFGVLRSLGLGSRRLVAMILVESLLLTGVGTAVGLGLGLSLSAWLGEVGINLASFASALEEYGIGSVIYPRVSSADLTVPISLAVVTAVLAAAWPAMKAARLRPAEALRAV